MRWKLIGGIFVVALFATSCGASASDVAQTGEEATTTTTDAAQTGEEVEMVEEPEPVEDHDEDGDHDDNFYEDARRDGYDISLEPELSLLAAVEGENVSDGWGAVDQWEQLPFGFEPSRCAAFDEILALEDNGVVTKFWLRDGAELYQHAIDVGHIDDAEDLQRLFVSLPDTCPNVSTGGNDITIAAGPQHAEHQFNTVSVTGSGSVTWLYEPNTTSHMTFIVERNLLIILQLVSEDVDDDLIELGAIAEIIDQHTNDIELAAELAFEAELEE